MEAAPGRAEVARALHASKDWAELGAEWGLLQ